MATAPVQKESATQPGLKRSLSVWQAVGLSLALMAPSHGGEHQPAGRGRGGAGGAARVPHRGGRRAARGLHVRPAVPVLPALRRRSTRSSGATLGPRTGVVAGWGLAGTYVFYAVTTAAAAGIFGARLLDYARRLDEPAGLGADPVRRRGARARAGARRAARPSGGTNVLLIVEVCTVALILIVTVVVLVEAASSHTAPGGSTSRWSVFSPEPRHRRIGAVPRRRLRLPVVRRLRGVRDPRRGGAQPDDGTSRGRSWAWRSSAASTSWSSPRWR